MEAPRNGSPDDGRAEALAQAIEALIFAADEPLFADEIAAVYAEIAQELPPKTEEIAEAVARLNRRYEAEGHALRIQEWAGGYRMTTAAEVAPYLKVFFRQERRRRLSRSLLETLAILAYRQPATKPEVDFVRGVDSDYALRKLMEIALVDVVGRADSVGRPLLYGTTPRFLEEFGLARLDDLPNLREIEELLDDPAFNREKARLLMLSSLPEAPANTESTEAPDEDEG